MTNPRTLLLAALLLGVTLLAAVNGFRRHEQPEHDPLRAPTAGYHYYLL